MKFNVIFITETDEKCYHGKIIKLKYSLTYIYELINKLIDIFTH